MTDLEALRLRAVAYQTRSAAAAVEVAFASQPQIVQTLEGPVRCQAGDAILSGVQRERWPVARELFERKYEPAAGQAAGLPGPYRKRFARVQATRLRTRLELSLSGDRGRLSGQPGDWCVWYAPDDAAIVAADVFPKTYELSRVPVYVGLAELPQAARAQAAAACAALQAMLPCTPLVCVDHPDERGDAEPIWFRVIDGASRHEPHAIAPSLEVRLADLAGGRVATALREALRRRSLLGFSRERIRDLCSARPAEPQPALGMLDTVVAQLAAVDRFNGWLAADDPDQDAARRAEAAWTVEPSNFIDSRQDLAEPDGLDRLVRIGAVADAVAVHYQTRWQQLVLATTKEIASAAKATVLGKGVALGTLLLRHPLSLVALGVFAALMLAAAPELAGQQWVAGGSLPFLLLYVAALVLAWWRYARAKSERWEGTHQDLRLLAEWLRVAHARLVADDPVSVLDCLQVRQHADSGWVRLALRSLLQAQPVAAAADPHGLAWVRRRFVDAQVDYHKGTLITRREKAIDVLSFGARLGARLFLGTLLALVAWEIVCVALHRDAGWPGHVLAITQLVSLAFWGAMRKTIDVLGLEQEVVRAEVVLHALTQAQRSQDLRGVRDATGTFAKDQEDWHSLHRSKPIEATTGA